jgi:hypothetical protein
MHECVRSTRLCVNNETALFACLHLFVWHFAFMCQQSAIIWLIGQTMGGWLLDSGILFNV